MGNVLLDESKEKVKKAFNEYSQKCTQSDEVVRLRAEQFLEELLAFVESSHGIVVGDYMRVGERIKQFEKDCEDCRNGVMKKNDLFKHGDFYVKERLKVSMVFMGLLFSFLIGTTTWIFLQQYNSLKTLTDNVNRFVVQADKRLSVIEAELSHIPKARIIE